MNLNLHMGKPKNLCQDRRIASIYIIERIAEEVNNTFE
jgi:hypothetical protein